MTIRPGAEPFYFPGGDVGCLLIHGFTSTPRELREMGQHLADQGMAALGVRLQGHGTKPSHLARTRWQDWLTSVEDGYHQLAGVCRQVVPIGLSMGGALALLLGSMHTVAGVVAMSTPAKIPPNRRTRGFRHLTPLLGPLSYILPYVPKPPPLDYHDPEAARTRISYSLYPTRSLLEVGRLLRKMGAILPQIQVPVLLMHAKADLGVSPSNAEKIFELLRTPDKQLIWIENSGHTMTLEPAKEFVLARTARFVARVTQASSLPAA